MRTECKVLSRKGGHSGARIRGSFAVILPDLEWFVYKSYLLAPLIFFWIFFCISLELNSFYGSHATTAVSWASQSQEGQLEEQCERSGNTTSSWVMQGDLGSQQAPRLWKCDFLHGLLPRSASPDLWAETKREWQCRGRHGKAGEGWRVNIEMILLRTKWSSQFISIIHLSTFLSTYHPPTYLPT